MDADAGARHDDPLEESSLLPAIPPTGAADEGDGPVYEIRVRGHLDARRARWFEGMTITLLDEGDTLIRGPVLDQSALHGLLTRVRDMGMALISVKME